MKYKTHYTIRTRSSCTHHQTGQTAEAHDYWTGAGWSPLSLEAVNLTRSRVWSVLGKATASLMAGEVLGPDIEVLKHSYHPDVVMLPDEDYTVIYRGTYAVD